MHPAASTRKRSTATAAVPNSLLISIRRTFRLAGEKVFALRPSPGGGLKEEGRPNSSGYPLSKFPALLVPECLPWVGSIFFVVYHRLISQSSLYSLAEHRKGGYEHGPYPRGDVAAGLMIGAARGPIRSPVPDSRRILGLCRNNRDVLETGIAIIT